MLDCERDDLQERRMYRVHLLRGAALCAVFGVALMGADLARGQESALAIKGLTPSEEIQLRAILPETERPKTDLERQRLEEEAAQIARAWLRAQGWYQARVEPRADPQRAEIEIQKGEKFTFRAPKLTIAPDPSDAALSAALDVALKNVQLGNPATAQAVLMAEAEMVAAAQQLGYAQARMLPRRAVVDHATGEMGVEFALEVGARAQLGAVEISPKGQIRPGLVRDLAQWDIGARYRPDALSALQNDLTETGAFSAVEVSVEPGEGVRPVLVALTPARARVIELGVSWSTFEGIGGELEWTRRNATRRTDSVTVSAALAQERQSAGAVWLLPHARGRSQALRLEGEISQESSTAFERAGLRFAATAEADARLKAAISYGVDLSQNRFSRAGGIDDALVLSSFVDWRRDETNRLLDATSGTYIQARVEPAIATGSATTGFVRATAQARAYHSLVDATAVTLAGRVRAGWIEPLLGNQDDLPPDRRFFAGGGGSVRGFAFNAIAPDSRTGLDVAPGGRGLLEVAGEVRARLNSKWGLVAFVDGASVFEDLSGAGEFRFGAGLGVRYDLDFAPLRLDIATPLDRREGEDEVAIYLSIGQAF